MPAPPDDALRSPDGTSWWDGTAWQPIEAGIPPIPQDAVRSPDGTSWWDGTAWQPIEAAPLAPPTPPVAVAAAELRDVGWVYGTFDVTAEAVTVRQRKVGPFGKPREDVYPLAGIASAEVYGSNLALKLHDQKAPPRGIQLIAQAEEVAATLRAFGVDATYTEAAEITSSNAETGHRGEIRVTTYKNGKELERDARKMMAAGWEMEGQSSKNQKTAIGRTAGKAVLTGGVGLLLMGRSKKGDTLTVTWVR